MQHENNLNPENYKVHKTSFYPAVKELWGFQIEPTKTMSFTLTSTTCSHPPPPAAGPSQDVLVISLRLVV